jgi:hypothetical protein
MATEEIIVFIYLPGETIAVPAGIFTYDNDLKVSNLVYQSNRLEKLSVRE